MNTAVCRFPDTVWQGARQNQGRSISGEYAKQQRAKCATKSLTAILEERAPGTVADW